MDSFRGGGRGGSTGCLPLAPGWADAPEGVEVGEEVGVKVEVEVEIGVKVE